MSVFSAKIAKETIHRLWCLSVIFSLKDNPNSPLTQVMPSVKELLPVMMFCGYTWPRTFSRRVCVI